MKCYMFISPLHGEVTLTFNKDGSVTLNTKPFDPTLSGTGFDKIITDEALNDN